MSRAIVLVGLSGSGKSTVGRLVALHSGLAFIDTDRAIEEREGRSIAAIFEAFGEAAFRDMESRMIAESCARAQVVATGGGAILRAENRQAVRRGNLVFWLDLPLTVLAQRLSGHRGGEFRPLLDGNVLARLRTQWLARRVLYAASAHVRIGKPPEGRFGSQQAARTIVRGYRLWTAEMRGR